MIVRKRGSYKTVEEFLKQKIVEISPAVNKIDGIPKAAKLIKKSIEKGMDIWVVGDYDVDGISTAAIYKKGLTKYISDNGYTNKVTTRLPHRISEGYGLSEKIVAEIPGKTLLITGDNGIAALSAIEAAKKKKITVIVTDHHLPVESGELPNADIIIDPNAISQCDFTGYCGAGIALKLMVELLEDKDCEELYSLAAVATIADVVPIKNENAVIAAFLPYVIDNNKGIRTLARKFGITTLDESSAGFQICPALNAAGRLFDAGAEDSLALILEEDEEKRKELAEYLFKTNQERKELTNAAVEDAVDFVETNGKTNPLVVVGNYHEGIVGLVASELSERYRVPAFVLTPTEKTDENGNKIFKGSARTYGDNNVKEILDNCKELLLKYGGHKAAAGLSLPETNIDLFREKSAKYALKPPEENVIFYDVELPVSKSGKEIEDAYIKTRICAPYGEGNEPPVFLVKNIPIFNQKNGDEYLLMGNQEQHIKLSSKGFDLLGFDMAQKYIDFEKPKMIDAVGTLTINRFNGNIYYQMEMLTFRPSA